MTSQLNDKNAHEDNDRTLIQSTQILEPPRRYRQSTCEKWHANERVPHFGFVVVFPSVFPSVFYFLFFIFYILAFALQVLAEWKRLYSNKSVKLIRVLIVIDHKYMHAHLIFALYSHVGS